LKQDDVVRPVGSGLGGCGAFVDLAGQSALDDEADEESALSELDDDEASCDEIRALTKAGAAETTPRAAINAASGIRDVMTITLQACNNAATLSPKL